MSGRVKCVRRALLHVYTGCPTRNRTRHFFNNSDTNEDITKFEQEYVRCVRNENECVCSAPNCCDTEQRSASQPGSVASGTHGISRNIYFKLWFMQLLPTNKNYLL